MDAASADRLLRARLDVAAGVDATAAYDAADLRERLTLAIKSGDYVDYRPGPLREAAPLFGPRERNRDFADHLAALRAVHRRKRALCEELDRAGLP